MELKTLVFKELMVRGADKVELAAIIFLIPAT